MHVMFTRARTTSRVSTLAQFAQYSAPFFVPLDFSAPAVREFATEVWNEDAARFVRALHARLSLLRDEEWTDEAGAALDACIVAAADESQLAADLARKALRFVLTAERVGAPLLPTMIVMTRDWVDERLASAPVALAEKNG